MESLDEWKKETYRILMAMDIESFWKQSGRKCDVSVAILAMHKLRAELDFIPEISRFQSVEYLRTNGHTMLRGRPLPAPGVLPT